VNKTAVVIAAALAATLGGIAVAPQASAATSLQGRVLTAARSKQGSPYAYGAAGPSRFDCSGLTSYVYKRSGKTIPRTAQGQFNAAHHIAWQSRKGGYLVFIGTSTHSITHVGVYDGVRAGKSTMINANTGAYRGRKVVSAPISEYLGGGRHAYYGHM
jgi:cell wall-associated NlpC family hydrolase